jgi:hypothetical protein
MSKLSTSSMSQAAKTSDAGTNSSELPPAACNSAPAQKRGSPAVCSTTAHPSAPTLRVGASNNLVPAARMRSGSRRAVSRAANKRASRRLGTCTNFPMVRRRSRASVAADDDDDDDSRAVVGRVGVPEGVLLGVPRSGVCSSRSPNDDRSAGVDAVSNDVRSPEGGRDRGDDCRACNDDGDNEDCEDPLPGLVFASGDGRRPRGLRGDARGGGVDGDGLLGRPEGEPMTVPPGGPSPGVHTPSLSALRSSSSHRLCMHRQHSTHVDIVPQERAHKAEGRTTVSDEMTGMRECAPREQARPGFKSVGNRHCTCINCCHFDFHGFACSDND